MDSLLAVHGPSLFDPAPYLMQLTAPTLWIFGGLDRSIPVAQSVAHLGDARDAAGLPISITVVPNMNHQWVLDGAMCQASGPHWDDSQVIVPWLRQQGLTSVRRDPAGVPERNGGDAVLDGRGTGTQRSSRPARLLP